MKKILILLLALFASHISLFNFQLSVLVAQDTLWVRYDDRFRANQFVSLQNVDSIVFRSQQLRFHSNTTALGYTSKTSKDFAPTDAADMQFTDPGRYLLKPDTYGGTDYYASGTTVTLSSIVPTGQHLTTYKANDINLPGNTYTMGSSDVSFSRVLIRAATSAS